MLRALIRQVMMSSTRARTQALRVVVRLQALTHSDLDLGAEVLMVADQAANLVVQGAAMEADQARTLGVAHLMVDLEAVLAGLVTGQKVVLGIDQEEAVKIDIIWTLINHNSPDEVGSKRRKNTLFDGTSLVSIFRL